MHKELELKSGNVYFVEYGSGGEHNYTIGKLKSEDACNLHWDGGRIKKWSDFPEKLDNSGYTVQSYRKIRLATEEEIKRLELLQKK